MRLPLSRNRQDVRLYHNCNGPAYSEVVGGRDIKVSIVETLTMKS
jgi:hypothetical protein